MFILSASENILLFVSGFGMLQAILSAVLLYYHPQSDRSVNRFLALYLAALTLPMILPLVQHFFSWQVITFVEPLITLIPAFLYLYICSFKERITWKKAWPHFILFFVAIILALWVYSVLGSKYPLTRKMPDDVKNNFLLIVPFNVRLAQRIIYYFLCRRALAFYQRSIVHLFSDTSRINLDWIKWLINGFLFLILVSMAAYFLMLRYPGHFDWWVLITGVIVSIYVLMALFKGLTQTTLWQIHPGINKDLLEEQLNKAGTLELNKGDSLKKLTYQKNHLPVTKVNEITGKIIALMESERAYQAPDLTLQNLADKLQVPSYQLSQAINEGLQKSFYDLINGYRVEEAKRLLLNPKNKKYTILSVGFEAGFNSKTTFNTVFKKFTGFTPTEYRNKQELGSGAIR